MDAPHAADLELAAAALRGDSAALERLHGLLDTEVRRVSTAVGADAAEVLSLARERLLTGETPRLSRYDGAGPLTAWLRTAAVRLASNSKRGQRAEVAGVEAPDAAAPDADPELALLRLQYREHFKAAFAEAVASLSPRERTVLRLHTLDGLSLASIGTMYRKDASTISRWLQQSRERLLEATRAHLARTLKLSGSDLESLLRAADSQLSLSLSGLLQSSAEP